MSQQTDNRPHQVGLFLNPAGQRRVDFQRACGEQFGRLFVADGIEQATHLLAQQQIDLLVIDLELFDRGIDLDQLGELIGQRKGAPTLLICPFPSASWLPGLMAFGPLDYAIGPLTDADLNQLIAAQIRAGQAREPAVPAAKEAELRQLLALRTRLQQALAHSDDPNTLAGQLCRALCSWPGVIHASLFQRAGMGELQLEAQYCASGLDLLPILQGGGRLLQSPLRHAFPGLLAASSGEAALLDAPEKSGEPELAIALRENGVAMVLGWPIAADGPGVPHGSLCLMFERAQRFSPDQLTALGDLAQLAGFGLRMAATSREAGQLLARLTQLATVDALTGVNNRRCGEELLEQEIKRARRYGVPLALIAFDVDHFRAINDRFGHPCGDAILRTLAETVQGALRASDLLVRAGGEEFHIIVPHTNAIDALKMAEKVRNAIAQTAFPGCDRLTVSLGVAQLGEHESGDTLVRRVSAALARAKRAGRDCVELAMK
jgi:diguanylate cyclase (GGDEF)-like protein